MTDTHDALRAAMADAKTVYRILVVHLDVLGSLFAASTGPKLQWAAKSDGGEPYTSEDTEEATIVAAGLNAAMTHSGKPMGFAMVLPYDGALGEAMKTERAKLPKTKEDETLEFFASLFGKVGKP